MTMVTIDDGVMKHQAWLGQLLNDDRNSAESTCDLVLESEGKQFRVHKNVVMLVSNYFRKMFTIEMKEKYEGVVKMHQIVHQRLANIIQFIYSGQIEITEENVLDILDDAEYTEIKVLTAKCKAFLLKVVSTANCLKLRAFAQRYNLGDLIDKTDQTIRENFETVVHHEDFKQLNIEDVSAILKLRNKNCEDTAFTGIVHWVNHNPPQRKELFVKLFLQLELTLLPVDFFIEVYNEELVKNNSVCSNLFAEASLKRFSDETLTRGFLLIDGQHTKQDCVVFDVTTKETKQFSKLNQSRHGASSARGKNKIFVMGGTKTKSHCKSCEMLDLYEQMKWVTMPDMLEHRTVCGSGFLQDHIYVTGGLNSHGELSSCEKFSILNNKWFRINNMSQKRSRHGTVVCNDLLYCIGGYNGEKRLTSCESYHERMQRWNEIAPLNQARNGLASVVLDTNIYAIGGYNGGCLSTVEKYEPKVNRWKLVAPLLVARSSSSACVVGNKIYVIGGWDGKYKLKSVEVYDPTLDVWKIAFETPKPVYAATVVAI